MSLRLTAIKYIFMGGRMLHNIGTYSKGRSDKFEGPNIPNTDNEGDNGGVPKEAG